MKMLGLVRKRHDGDGWMVFSEVGDKPGLMANRWADALALGVWKSNGFEAHLYEFKISREDLKRELRDPTKADAVGKYCTYWWLVVSDESVLRDLVVPDYWGILIPKKRGGSEILTVHRKAPKRKPQPLDATFVISLVRNMAKHYKSNADYDRMREELLAKLEGRVTKLEEGPDKDAKIRELERKLERIEGAVSSFAVEAGVDLDELKSGTWSGRHLGATFKLAADLEGRLARGDLGKDIAQLSSFAQILEGSMRELAETAVKLRGLAGLTACDPNCRANSKWVNKSPCSCGAQPLSEAERKLAADARVAGPDTQAPCSFADNHFAIAPGFKCPGCGHSPDDQGVRGDRGSAGAPEQDAGVQLWDLSDAVSHGKPAP